MSATPRPWEVTHFGAGPIVTAKSRHLPLQPGLTCLDTVARVDFGLSQEDEANAELIARAVNAFDALLAVAKAAQDYLPDDDEAGIVLAMQALEAAHPDWRSWI